MSQSASDNHMRPSTIFRFLPMLCLLTLFLTLGSSGAWAANSRYIVVFREGTPLTVQESISSSIEPSPSRMEPRTSWTMTKMISTKQRSILPFVRLWRLGGNSGERAAFILLKSRSPCIPRGGDLPERQTELAKSLGLQIRY